MRLSLPLLLLFVALGATTHYSQVNRRPRPLPPPESRQDRRAGPPPPLAGSPHEEMLDRAALRALEEEHKETLERAREGARLGDELLTAFEQHKSLTRDDLKKLERLEKLTRNIRGRAGGSDDKEAQLKLPADIGGAVARVAELSEDLRERVEKTSRHVVSAGVIERSNELIEVIRLVRTLTR